MRHTDHLKILTVFIAVLLCGCGNTPNGNDNESEGRALTAAVDEVPEVNVITLKRTDFNHELVSNGKLTAHAVADLSFQSQQEVITRIYVKNGDRVQKGDRLAEVELFKLANKRLQTYDAMQKARLDCQDVLIGQGYTPADSANIPQSKWELAKVKSGFSQAEAQYELARYEEENGVLRAPFAGTVANLSAKEFNKPDGTKPFCRIIENDRMEVEFTVLESELPLIKPGDKVQVTPYADPQVEATGAVSVINPVVDENGMVKVKATIRSTKRLFEGGNVRVNVSRTMAGQFVVPKSSVVMRSGRQVLFTVKEGKAFWNYIQTEAENATEYVVSGETIKEGEPVIVDNNINLAHESPVKVSEER